MLAFYIMNKPEQPTQHIEDNPFDLKGPSKVNMAVGAMGVILAGLGVYVARRYGIDLDSELVPKPPVYPEITDAIIAANDGLREVGPYVAGFGIASQTGYYLYSRFNPGANANYELASTGYSGVDSIEESGRLRRAFKGVGLLTFAGLFIASSTSIEEEVSSGPIRTVTAAGDMLTDGGEDPVYVFEHEGTHFMGDSRVSSEVVADLEDTLGQDVTVVPFERGLPTIYLPDGGSTEGIILAIPEKLIADGANSQVALDEGTMPVIVDESLGLNIGDDIRLTSNMDGREMTVVGETGDASGMNRSVVVTGLDAYTEQIEGQEAEGSSVFGVAISGASEQEVENSLAGLGHEDVSVLSEDQFIDNNKKFWKSNGTAILLQQIAYLGAFAGTAIGAVRRNKLQQNIKEVGAMLSMGMDKATLTSIEVLRATRSTGRSMAVATAGLPVFAGMLNAAVQGLEVGTSIRSISAAYTVMLGASVLSSAKAVGGFVKRVSPARMIKG